MQTQLYHAEITFETRYGTAKVQFVQDDRDHIQTALEDLAEQSYDCTAKVIYRPVTQRGDEYVATGPTVTIRYRA